MVKKTQFAAEEPRIYVIVPETVQVLGPKKTIRSITMEPGRLMAQVAHVTGRMRLDRAFRKYDQNKLGPVRDWIQYEEITTVVLSVRNVRALERVHEDLVDCARMYDLPGPYVFEDHNPSVYGIRGRLLTAVCTAPVLRSQIMYAIDYLELYGA